MFSSSKLALLASLYLMVPVFAFAASGETAYDAALELKRSHVERFYNSRVSNGRSEESCRDDLAALHKRELSAMALLVDVIGRVNEAEFSRAMSSCYSPTHDYEDLIVCREKLVRWIADANSLVDFSYVDPDKLDVKAFVSNLPTREGRYFLLCLRGKVGLNFEQTVLHNMTKGGDDALWAMKVHAFQNGRLAILAEDIAWSTAATYFRKEADNISSLIRGDITEDDYQAVSASNGAFYGRILSEFTEAEFLQISSRFSSECERGAAYIAGEAKYRASQ